MTEPYKGLDYCDECGAKLDPENRLWGLCADCARKLEASRVR